MGSFTCSIWWGLEARLAGNNDSIGTVSNLISGGNDLLEINLNSGKTVLVPFVM